MLSESRIRAPRTLSTPLPQIYPSFFPFRSSVLKRVYVREIPRKTQKKEGRLNVVELVQWNVRAEQRERRKDRSKREIGMRVCL